MVFRWGLAGFWGNGYRCSKGPSIVMYLFTIIFISFYFKKKNGTLGGYLSATFGYMHSSLEFLARDAFGKQM